jgi:hypothetical protein
MKAKELYRVLQTELGPWLLTRGFRKRGTSRLVFQKLAGDKYHSVWFQCGKWGWDAYAGGEFFANLTVSESPDVESGRRHMERVNHFLTDIELARARKYRNEVVERIPRPPESYFQMLQAGFSKSTSEESARQLVAVVRGYFEPEPIPYRRNQDFSMRYWEPGDVSGWAAFIMPVLPRALEEMESWPLPAT